MKLKFECHGKGLNSWLKVHTKRSSKLSDPMPSPLYIPPSLYV